MTRTVSGNASTGAHDSTCRDNDSSLSNYEELLAAEQRAGDGYRTEMIIPVI